MTEPNEREKKLAREHSLVTGDGEDDSGIAIGHLLARYRAELLKPENVLREAERLLRVGNVHSLSHDRCNERWHAWARESPQPNTGATLAEACGLPTEPSDSDAQIPGLLERIAELERENHEYQRCNLELAETADRLERERDAAREQRDAWAKQCNFASEAQADASAHAARLESEKALLVIELAALRRLERGEDAAYERGRAEERAAVVAWLREEACVFGEDGAIERGDHVQDAEKETP